MAMLAKKALSRDRRADRGAAPDPCRVSLLWPGVTRASARSVRGHSVLPSARPFPPPREAEMTYVVTETCIKCKYTDCVDVCPVDCFREGPNMLVIDPDECIDCTLCVAECPVEAIFAEDDVPDTQKKWTALNAELAKAWKPIIEKKPAQSDADEGP